MPTCPFCFKVATTQQWRPVRFVSKWRLHNSGDLSVFFQSGNDTTVAAVRFVSKWRRHNSGDLSVFVFVVLFFKVATTQQWRPVGFLCFLFCFFLSFFSSSFFQSGDDTTVSTCPFSFKVATTQQWRPVRFLFVIFSKWRLHNSGDLSVSFIVATTQQWRPVRFV